MLQTDSIAKQQALPDTTAHSSGSGTTANDSTLQEGGAADSLSAQARQTPLPETLARLDSLAHRPAVDIRDTLTLNLDFQAKMPVMIWGDTIETPRLLQEPPGNYGIALPYNMSSDNVVMGILTGSILVVFVILATLRHYIATQAKQFFMPTNNVPNLNALKTPAEKSVPIVMCTVLCLLDGLLLYAYASSTFDLTRGIYPPLLVMGVCMGTFGSYYLLRWLLYAFVNWVFFRRSDRKLWNGGFSFLITSESLLFLPIVVACINLDWDIEKVAIPILSAYALIRFALLYHSFRIFFSKIYGIMHLFAYLCTLELVPLLTLAQILRILSSHLIEK